MEFLSALLIFWTVKSFYETISGASFSALPVKSRWILTFFPILLTSLFILHHLAYGQANILILAVTVLAISLIKKKRAATGGLFLGLAIVLKVIAAPFVIWFVGKKSWRVILGVAIGIITGAIIIPSLVLGLELNNAYLDFWIRNIVLADDLGTAKVPLGVNLSLQAQLLHFGSGFQLPQATILADDLLFVAADNSNFGTISTNFGFISDSFLRR